MTFLKASLITFCTIFLLSACLDGQPTYTDNGIKTTDMSDIITVDKLVISPAKKTINKATSIAYTATLIAEDGTKTNVSDDVTWSADNTKLISIDQKGVVKSIAGKGRVYIYAELKPDKTHADQGKARSELTITDKAVTKLLLTPKRSDMVVGSTKQLTATAIFDDNSQQDVSRDVTWKAEDKLVSVDNLGLVTAIQLTQGSTIDASFPVSSINTKGNTSEKLTAKASVVVYNKHEIDHLNITPSTARLNIGQSQQFYVTASLTNGKIIDVSHDVNWNSNPPKITKIDKNGLLTALMAGKANVIASIYDKSKQAKIEVLPNKLVSLNISPKNLSVPVGSYIHYSAVGLYSDGSIFDLSSQVAWRSSATDVAIIEGHGMLRAIEKGSTNITATISGISDTTPSNVTDATLESITVLPQQETLPSGLKIQYSAYGHFSDNSETDLTDVVSWTIDDSEDANFNSHIKGLLTTLKPGDVKVTATFGNESGTANLTITKIDHLKNVSITPFESKSSVGTYTQFNAMALYKLDNGTTQNVDVTKQTNWTTNEPDNISFDKNGNALALSATTAPAIINASFEGKTYNATMDVVNTKPNSIQVTPINKDISKGGNLQYTAIAYYKDGSKADITRQAHWTSTDDKVVSINSLGKKPGLAIGQSVGNAFILATFSGVSASKVPVKVLAPTTLKKLKLIPSTKQQIINGLNYQYKLMGIFEDGHQEDLTSVAKWSSENPSVASVDSYDSNAGLVTSHAKGDVDITALVKTLSATANLQVNVIGKAAIFVAPSKLVENVGGKGHFKSIAIDDNNQYNDVTQLTFWALDDPVDKSSVNIIQNGAKAGEITGVKVGSADIDPEFSGSARTDISAEIINDNIKSVKITPNNKTYSIGDTYQYRVFASYDDGRLADITDYAVIKSSDYATATFDLHNMMTAIGGGKAHLTTVFDGKSSDDQSLNVVPANVDSIEIIPSGAMVDIGSKGNFRAIIHHANGTIEDATDTVTWKSLDDSILTVDPKTGKATVEGNVGVVKVSASTDSLTAESTINVVDKKVAGISIIPDNDIIKSGDKKQFNVMAVYQDNSISDVTAFSTLESNDTNTVTVGEYNVVTGIATGIAKLDAIYKNSLKKVKQTAVIYVNNK